MSLFLSQLLLVLAWQVLSGDSSYATEVAQSDCLLNLRGSGSLNGTFTCSGVAVSVAFHPSLLLRKDAFRADGVVKARSCQRNGCLITICEDSAATIKATVVNVSVPGVRLDTDPKAILPAVVCLTDRASARFRRPVFQGNTATGVLTEGNATARIEDGVFNDGLAPAGASFVARGTSTIEIYRSTFVNNTSIGQ